MKSRFWLLCVFLFYSDLVHCSSNEVNLETDNRDLFEYLMESSSHATGQLPPGYLYNSNINREENQIEIPALTTSNNSSLVHEVNETINSNDYSLLNKKTKLNDFIKNSIKTNKNGRNLHSISSPLSSSSPYDLWKKEPYFARSNKDYFNMRTFGKPRKNFPIDKTPDLMKSADISSASTSYYSHDAELEDPNPSLKTTAIRGFPLYNTNTYGNFYAAQAAADAEARNQYYNSHSLSHFYEPHHEMSSYGKSDFYWLIPIAFLIGAGALLLPIISVFMTTLVTSGTLTLNAGRRRKRNVDVLVGEIRKLLGSDTYSKIEVLWSNMQKALDKFDNLPAKF